MSRKRRTKIALLSFLVPILFVLGLGGFTYANMQRQNREHQLADAIADSDNIRALALLAQGVSPNARQSTGPQLSFLDTFFALFKRSKNGSLSGNDQIGTPALVLATGWPNNDDLLRVMLEKGADVNLRDSTGRNALLSAAQMATTTGDNEVFKVLLKKGGDVKASDKDGLTVLHLLAGTPDEALLRSLLAKGADVNAKTKENVTPLMMAAQTGSARSAEILLTAGADAEAVDDGERSALVWALGRKQFYSSYPAVVDQLIKHGVDINMRFSDNSTPLMYASQWCDASAVKLLLERGADVTAKDDKGKTALSLTNDPDIKTLLNKALAKRSKKQ